MALVINRQTGEILPSVNTPDYPETDWIINPDLTNVTLAAPYLVIEGDTVRDMTTEEVEAYVTAHPQSPPTAHLLDGTPAFEYAHAAGIPISIAGMNTTFTTPCWGAQSFFLGVAGTDGSAFFPRPAIITSISLQIHDPVNTAITARLRRVDAEPSDADVLTLVLDAGNISSAAAHLAALVDANTAIRCYIEGSGITNPIVNIHWHWRN